MSSKLKFRPEIDGLRAIAVLAVVFYHFGLGPFQGGFIGVDVFFVISGYLIGRIVIEDARAGKLSLLDFYERRAKRLAGPLMVVLAFTLGVGLVMMMPDDLEALSESLVASAFYFANFYFYWNTDYFDTAAHLKPLLHMWSLAVEEQFYLLFPLLVIASLKLFRNLSALWLVAGISFASAAYMFISDQQAAFFLLPFRSWELLLGTIVFLVQRRIAPSGAFADALSLLGLVLIAWAAYSYSGSTPFPGPYAAIPCLGAALIILANTNAITWVGSLLASIPVVWIGRLSYSIYLWHWPLYVFTLYYLDRPLVLGERLALVVMTILLSWLTFHLVEQPMRHRENKVLRSENLLASVAVAAFICIAAVPAIISQGLPRRLSDESLRYSNARDDWTSDQFNCVDIGAEKIGEGQVCQFGPTSEKQVLLWGDSHSTALLPAFQRASERLGFGLTFVGTNGCPPLLDVASAKPNCLAANSATVQLIETGAFDVVAMAANWASYGSNNWISIAPEMRGEALQSTWQSIFAAGSTALVIGQVPEYTVDVPNYLAKLSFLGWVDALLGYDRTPPASTTDPAYLVEASSELPDGAEVIWPKDLLCGGSSGCLLTSNGLSLYKDGGHLSATGSAIADAAIEGALRRQLDVPSNAAQRTALGLVPATQMGNLHSGRFDEGLAQP